MRLTFTVVAIVAAMFVSTSVAVIAQAGPAAAYKPPVIASGSISCTGSGTAKLTPPMLNGATGTSTLTIKGTLSGCEDSAGITGGRIKGSFTVPSDCAALSYPTMLAFPGSYQIKWSGTQRFADTSVSGPTIGSQFYVDNSQGEEFLSFEIGATTGSFASDGTGEWTNDGTFGQPASQVLENCLPKVRGNPLTGGFKKFTLPTMFFQSF